MEGSKENPIQLPEVVITPAKHISENGIELIAHFEGLRLDAYPDPGTGGAPWTIGYGATFYEDGAKVKPGDNITVNRAKQLLAYHLRKFETTVLKKINRPLLQHEFDAAISFAFNAGISYKTSGGTWRDYDLWSKINSGVSGESMKKYWENLAVTAAGNRLKGLERRRKAEANLYLTGNVIFQ